MTFVIAIEGSPLAGKSTLAQRVTVRWPSVLYFPDYVEMLDWHDIPVFNPGSTENQLNAFRRFMAAESSRYSIVANNRPRLALLDRSVDTLLAHAYALDKLFSFSSYSIIRNELAERNHLTPDITIYMRAHRKTLLRRHQLRDRDDSCIPFINEEFLRSSDEFFTSGRGCARQVHMVRSESVENAIPELLFDIIEGEI